MPLKPLEVLSLFSEHIVWEKETLCPSGTKVFIGGGAIRDAYFGKEDLIVDFDVYIFITHEVQLERLKSTWVGFINSFRNYIKSFYKLPPSFIDRETRISTASIQSTPSFTKLEHFQTSFFDIQIWDYGKVQHIADAFTENDGVLFELFLNQTYGTAISKVGLNLLTGDPVMTEAFIQMERAGDKISLVYPDKFHDEDHRHTYIDKIQRKYPDFRFLTISS